MAFRFGANNRQITPPGQSGAKGSVRLLLTKNPACCFSCLSLVAEIGTNAAISFFSFILQILANSALCRIYLTTKTFNITKQFNLIATFFTDSVIFDNKSAFLRNKKVFYDVLISVPTRDLNIGDDDLTDDTVAAACSKTTKTTES